LAYQIVSLELSGEVWPDGNGGVICLSLSMKDITKPIKMLDGPDLIANRNCLTGQAPKFLLTLSWETDNKGSNSISADRKDDNDG